MLTEIFIENMQLDLSDDMQLLFTYQIDDIKSFGTKNTNFSKTITLPGTANNNAAFGFIFDVNQSNGYTPSQSNIGYNFNPAKSARCNVFIDHIQIFKGIIRVLAINVNNGVPEYECSVFGELGGFMSQIANKYLTDLDFSAYDAAWNYTNIAASWNTIAGGGVYYPLIDYGNCVDGHDIDISGFRPALYLREYLLKILGKTDYTWDFPLLGTSLFDKLVIPHSEDQLYLMTKYPIVRSKSTSQTTIWVDSMHNILSAKITFPQANNMNDFTSNVGTDIFTYTGSNSIAGKLSLTFNASYDGTDGLLYGTQWRIAVYKNGTFFGNLIVIPFNSNPSFTGGTPSQTMSNVYVSIYGLQLNNGDTIQFKGEFQVTGGGYYRLDIGISYFLFETPNNQAHTAIYGDILQINNCIPKNIKQTDLFTSVLKMFNLYVYENPQEEKKLYIYPYPSFYNNTVVDWNSKIDRGQTISLKPMSELTARLFNFLYDTDSDYWNDFYKKKYGKGFGDYLLDTQYEFTNDKSETKLIFSSSPLLKDNGGKHYTPMYKLSGTTMDKMNTKIRLMIAKKITGVTNWKLTKDGGGTIIHQFNSPANYYGYAGHLDNPSTPTFDLNWNYPQEIFYALSNPYTENNLFNTYWLDYMYQINHKDSQLMTCYVNLSNHEIETIDWSVKYYIDGAYWRLNKIIDFNPIQRNLTKVELLKVV